MQARHRWWIGYGAAPVASLVLYAIMGPSSATTVAASLPIVAAAIGAGLRWKRPWRYRTWAMRTETAVTGGGLAAVVYLAAGWPLLALMDVITPSRVLPLFEPSILRFMVVWPFYMWLLTGCGTGILPCDPAETAPASGDGGEVLQAILASL